MYRVLSGPQGRSEQVRKNLTPPGFDPRTIKTVARRYIDCAIPDTFNLVIKEINLFMIISGGPVAGPISIPSISEALSCGWGYVESGRLQASIRRLRVERRVFARDK